MIGGSAGLGAAQETWWLDLVIGMETGAGEKVRWPGCNQNVISVIFIFG